jgi:hypothetical protein
LILIFFHQIPGVSCQLSFDALEKCFRAEKFDLLLTTKENPQKLVKADKMVHMRVGDEYMGHLEKVSGSEIAKVPQIK